MMLIFWLADAVLKLFFKGRQALILENVALRQQLATYKRIGRRPRIRTADRVFWIWISKLWNNWRTPLIIVKPQTVIRWHRQGFRLYWRRKSTAKMIGRPTISRSGEGWSFRGVREGHKARTGKPWDIVTVKRIIER